MTALTGRLRDEIAEHGPLRFDAFMERALFDPQGGYYAAGRARIGREGDFHTSVSIGSAFGRVLAAQCEEVWRHLGCPENFQITEQGGNDGRLAHDILTALQLTECFSAVHYRLIEPFPALRTLQARTLTGFSGIVDWAPALDEPFTGIHLTNEYADAIPVRIFAKGGTGWLERHVDIRDGRLCFADLPTSDTPGELPQNVPIGYLAEIRPQAQDWIRDVALTLQRGMILAIDYGYPRDQLHAGWRTSGTLSCYRANHRDDNPLVDPGEKDITAHVDFTSLAEAGLAGGLDLAGFTDQHHFIVGAGTNLLLKLESEPPGPERDATLRALKTLLHPETMGTQFKYLALTRGLDSPLSGFRHAREPRTALGLA